MANTKNPVPEMIREYQIGNTCYVVKSRSKEQAQEDAVTKVKRPVSYTHLIIFGLICSLFTIISAIIVNRLHIKPKIIDLSLIHIYSLCYLGECVHAYRIR